MVLKHSGTSTSEGFEVPRSNTGFLTAEGQRRCNSLGFRDGDVGGFGFLESLGRTSPLSHCSFPSAVFIRPCDFQTCCIREGCAAMTTYRPTQARNTSIGDPSSSACKVHSSAY